MTELAQFVPVHELCRRKFLFCLQVVTCATPMCAGCRLDRVMSPDRRQTLGQRGEQIAARHLERAGWRIVERNYRVREGEIDLIARRGDVLSFCEVKTLVDRRGAARGPANPVESVGHRKQAKVRRMARMWLAAHAGTGAHVLRLDVIGVVVSATGELLRLDHLEGAF